MQLAPLVKVGLANAFVIGCWAYSPVGIRIGLESFEPGQLALLRFLVASVFMAGVALVAGISLPRLRDVPLLFLLGFFAVTLHHLALNFGQQSVSAGAASVLAQSTPLFSALLGHFFLRERINAEQWGFISAGLLGAGVVVLSAQGAGDMNAHGLLILVAALSWSVYFVLQKKHSDRYSGLTMVCYTLWSGTALLLFYSPGLFNSFLHATPATHVAVVTLGIFPSALAYLAWAYVLSKVTIAQAAITLYLVPPCAILIAAWALGEWPSLWMIAGAAIIIANVASLNFLQRKRAKATQPMALV